MFSMAYGKLVTRFRAALAAALLFALEAVSALAFASIAAAAVAVEYTDHIKFAALREIRNCSVKWKWHGNDSISTVVLSLSVFHRLLLPLAPLTAITMVRARKERLLSLPITNEGPNPSKCPTAVYFRHLTCQFPWLHH